MRKILFLRWWRAVLCSLMCGWILIACAPNKPAFKSIDITGADYATGFAELADQHGQLRSLSDFKGKVVVVFFGYTQCPDVCPTSLSELVKVKQLLGQQGPLVQSVFISVDPQRDSPELLKAYLQSFGDDFLGFSPSPEKLAALAKHFKVYYKKSEGKTPTSYTMDHTAGHYVFDPQGRLRLFSRYGMGAADWAADVAILLNGQ